MICFRHGYWTSPVRQPKICWNLPLGGETLPFKSWTSLLTPFAFTREGSCWELDRFHLPCSSYPQGSFVGCLPTSCILQCSKTDLLCVTGVVEAFSFGEGWHELGIRVSAKVPRSKLVNSQLNPLKAGWLYRLDPSAVARRSLRGSHTQGDSWEGLDYVGLELCAFGRVASKIAFDKIWKQYVGFNLWCRSLGSCRTSSQRCFQPSSGTRILRHAPCRTCSYPHFQCGVTCGPGLDYLDSLDHETYHLVASGTSVWGE